MVVLLLTGILVMASPNYTLAADLVIWADKGYQLTIIPEGPLFQGENMAPGDVESALVTIKNEGEQDFKLLLTAEEEEGESILFHELRVTVLVAGEEVLGKEVMGAINDFPLGIIPAGQAQDYTFLVEFPPTAGNEFQAAELAMKWIFRATWPQGPGTDPGEEPGDDPSDDPTPPPADAEEPSETAADEALPIDGEEIPAGMVEVEKEEEEPIAIEEEEIPGGPGEIPRTGEEIPFLSYGLGLALLAGGLALVRRRA